jgi:chromosome partitioning protein
LARTTGKRAVVVPNFVHPSGKAEEETIRGVAAGHKLETTPFALHEFQVHRDGSFQGKTAQEVDPNSRAAGEIKALWEWFRAQVHLGTDAPVHKVT